MMKELKKCDHVHLEITYNLPESIYYSCVCGIHDVVWLNNEGAKLVCVNCDMPEMDCECEEGDE